MKAVIASLLRRAADRVDPAPQAQLRHRIDATRAHGGPALDDERMAQCTRAVTLLERAGHVVAVKNGGLHLKVRAGRVVADYWPTTGKWWIDRTKTKGHGLDALLREIGGAA